MALLPLPDQTNAYSEKDQTPSKNFYNWLKSLRDTVSGNVSDITTLQGRLPPTSPGNPALLVTSDGATHGGNTSGAFNAMPWTTLPINVGGYWVSTGWQPPAGVVVLCGQVFVSGTISAGAQIAAQIAMVGVANIAQGNAPALAGGGSCNVMQIYTTDGTRIFNLLSFAVTSDASNYNVNGNAALSYFAGAWISK